VFEKRIEIRWRDLDAYGHVNQAVYVTYAEEVLDAWLRERLGLAPGHVWDYVAKKTTVVYQAEVRQTDVEVVGTARVLRVGTTSVTVAIELRRPDGEVAAEVESVLVAIAGRGGAPRALTPSERAALNEDAPDAWPHRE
jgi:acyl-CoA thioester hydrolase